ncbi:DUF4359 domain-containing protein [Plectonema cf. radiosum LEGE 06105]|uniref:DUF4359 domain-containing protein n=1 Tax=Plectonema cf. radiosum LEGE 06105 TaxID=945769 RepID=A0A8J7JXC3_9CYAN|nr:DUF4359 domain-containing protein [Plectonema radiosum]MBE9216550.1 DUF4359 domain-containing protein [Plectonema cf. radiosum LEGE 06105]
MKIVSIVTYAGVAALIALGVVMASTNPSRTEYEEYAAQRLNEYIKEEGCSKTPKLLDNLIKFNCANLIDSLNPQIKQIINASTQQRDYLLFSIYETDLQINSLIPSYKFETVGALDNFFTYKAEKE